MIEDKRTAKAPAKAVVHNLIMENRERLSVSGVADVESFDEESIILHTDMGMLVVKGEDLHINKLNIESGELIIEGEISSCTYSDEDSSRSKGLGFFKKMFR